MSGWIGWDAEFYSNLSTDEVCVSLSEQEIYLLGQVITMLKWSTRWEGDISALDLEAISGNLEDKLAEASCGGTMSCEDIADCIESDVEVQNSIANNYNIQLSNLMNNANSGINFPQIDAETSTIMNTDGAIGANKSEPVKELPNCDLDRLWAGIRDGIVARLDDNARTVLEFLVSKADISERATALIGAIPIFGSMAKSVLDQMVEIAPDMLNLFDSYSSISNMDEIACEIFGIVCSECRYPTFEEVYQYYAFLGITGMNDLDDLAISLATDLLFASTETAALAFYHSLIAYELLVLGLGNKFYGLSGADVLTRLASLGEDAANDNWQVLCDACDDQYATYTWDFKQSPQNTYFVPGFFGTNQHQWIAGKGFIVQEGQNAASIGLPLEPTWVIRSIGVKMSKSVSTNYNSRELHLRPTIRSATGQSTLSSNNGMGDLGFCRENLLDVSGFQEFALRVAPATGAGVGYVESITIVFKQPDAPDLAIPTSDTTICS